MTVHVLPVPAPRTGRHDLDLPALVARTGALLAGGVPLTLLLDLADPAGPRSRARYAEEGGEDATWLLRPA